MVAHSENVATRKLKNAFEINAAFFTFRVFQQEAGQQLGCREPMRQKKKRPALQGAFFTPGSACSLAFFVVSTGD